MASRHSQAVLAVEMREMAIEEQSLEEQGP